MSADAVTHDIEIQYFAVLRERAGRTREKVNTAAATAAELYDELAARHDFGLPRSMLRVAVNDEFSDVDSILYMMTGDGADYAQLKKVAEGFRQGLLKVPGVTKIDLYGTQDERIFVEFDMRTLAGLGFDPSALEAALAAQTVVRPTGVIQTGDESISLRMTNQLIFNFPDS